MDRPRTSAGRSCPRSCSSTPPTTAGEHAREPRQPYGELPRLRAHAQRGLRQADLHADLSSLLLNAQLPRLASASSSSDSSAQSSAPTTGSGNEARQKIATVEGSWVIGSRSHATFKLTISRSRRRPSRQHLGCHADDGHRHDAGHRELDHAGPAHGARAGGHATAYNAFIQPLIDRYGYLDGRRAHGRRRGRLCHAVQRPATSSATTRRSATTCTLGDTMHARAARRLPVVHATPRT